MEKNKRKSCEHKLPYIVKPGEYMGQIFITIVINIISLFLIYVGFKYKISLVMIICELMFLSCSIYYLIVSFCLINKKTYIIASNEYVEFKKIFKSKRIDINDIKYIQQTSGSRGDPAKVILKCDNSKIIYKTDLCIPISWFSLKDLEKLKDILIYINKNIELR